MCPFAQTNARMMRTIRVFNINASETEALIVPLSLSFGTYVKIGTIQRRLAWPLHKDNTMNTENGLNSGEGAFLPKWPLFLN